MDIELIEVLNSKNENILDTLPIEEIVEVIDGKLYLNSYSGGIVKWDEEMKSYFHYFWGNETVLDIKSFKYKK